MRTNRFIHLSFAACLAAMILTTAAEAQPPGGGRGPGGQRGGGQFGGGRGGQFGGGRGGFGGGTRGGFTVGKTTLLTIEDVLDELKVDDVQNETIKAALESYREDRTAARPDRSAFEGLSDDERRAKFEEMRKQGEELQEKAEAVLVALLSDEQAQRLDQIALQVRLRGGIAGYLRSDEGHKKLSIKDEQVAKLEEVEKELGEARQKMFQEMFAGRGRGNQDERSDEEREAARTEMREKMEKFQKESEAKVMAVLTGEQKKTLDDAKGKPFELDMRALMQRGGRGGFGGPGGPGGRGRGDGGGRGRGDGGGERRRPAAEDDAV